MPRAMRLDVGLVTCLAAFSGVADAFWRLPCRGRSGLARMDPLMDPGEPSYHVHAVHGSGAFSMSSDADVLKAADCTSCEVKQDKSAYWAPALYFIDEDGDAELVDEVGGMLAYYLLYGDDVKAFPEGFRMIAGDPFKRNFPWPVPDPPKSEWTGKQGSQEALAQKAVGFNCLNYEADAEPSLGRHFMPNKTYLDENCKDGIRIELMFPSCWNGKDVDTDDHRSHMAYPSQVMDGTCPEGFETRLVSLFFETIWDTYAFRHKEGEFVLSHGDPTGFGYHADFIQGWEQDVLEAAVEQCTNPSGEVEDCPVFELQSEIEQKLCTFDLPDLLKDEDVEKCSGGLPNKILIEYGPEDAFPIKYATPTSSSAASTSKATLPTLSLPSISLPDLGGMFAESSTTSASSTTTPPPPPSTTETPTPSTTEEPTTTTTPTWTPTPVTSLIQGPITQEIVFVEQQVVILVDEQGSTVGTQTGDMVTVSTTLTTATTVISTEVTMATEPPAHAHRRRHAHGHRARAH
ncbi:hypothetical protein BDW42DRAFT_155499 [Aspergillus taichungensis]|uniref:DUF1996 domain-containing protein n=1 Tax=Aspergillus taichungensis TaxID=482145 RepID=A0A2J5HKI5_9EURO|nr:hypothetical protein BDW42DRAFT_155499 [Aspergillus taichungensis]